jgi:hypothetical protein
MTGHGNQNGNHIPHIYYIYLLNPQIMILCVDIPYLGEFYGCRIMIWVMVYVFLIHILLHP